MRVLFVVRSWGIGGEQRAISLITKGLSDAGYEVSLRVLSSRPTGPIIVLDPRVQISYAGMAGGQRVGLIKHSYRLRSFVRSGRFDIVIGFGTGPAIMTCIASLATSTPIVVCERNDPQCYPKAWRILRACVYRVADGAVFQTIDSCGFFPGSYFRHRRVIANPVDPVVRQAVHHRRSDRRRKAIVNTSRLTQPKNQLMLLEAFSAIASRHPDYWLEMYGEGPMKRLIMEEIRSRGLEDRVFVYPPREAIMEAVANCEVFVLTSDHEGFPNSLAEAMCLGLAVVATDCRIGGPRAMIADGQNGRLVPVGDLNALISVLDELLSDPEQVHRLGDAASHLADELMLEKIARAWSDFFRQVRGRREIRPADHVELSEAGS